MYAGRIVETGAAEAVLDRPAASLHARPDRQRAQPQPARREAAADSRHDAEPAQPAAGLRLPHPLPARRCRLRTGTGAVAAGAGPDDALLPSAARGAGMSEPRRSSNCAASPSASARPTTPPLASRAPSRADLVRRRRTRWCGRSTTSISPWHAARWSVWSGNPAAASPPSAAWSPASCRHRTARCCSRARTSPRCRRTARAMRS